MLILNGELVDRELFEAGPRDLATTLR